MIPPSKSHLCALAGWAIAARGNCSDRQHLALCHFEDGCGELSEVIADLAPPVPARIAPRNTVRECGTEPLAEIPAVARQVLGVQSEAQCRHKFNIHTQICDYCGLTYLQAHGRRSELM